jgi:hypothetical protein
MEKEKEEEDTTSTTGAAAGAEMTDMENRERKRGRVTSKYIGDWIKHVV